VRAHVRFARTNLLEIEQLPQRFEFIFCRNVMVYFDQDARQRAVGMLERHLVPGGYLFVSHAESLSAIRHDLQLIAPAVYRRSRP
jgi:chemotaxis protein methyltransferase CheR